MTTLRARGTGSAGRGVGEGGRADAWRMCVCNLWRMCVYVWCACACTYGARMHGPRVRTGKCKCVSCPVCHAHGASATSVYACSAPCPCLKMRTACHACWRTAHAPASMPSSAHQLAVRCALHAAHAARIGTHSAQRRTCLHTEHARTFPDLVTCERHHHHQPPPATATPRPLPTPPLPPPCAHTGGGLASSITAPWPRWRRGPRRRGSRRWGAWRHADWRAQHRFWCA